MGMQQSFLLCDSCVNRLYHARQRLEVGRCERVDTLFSQSGFFGVTIPSASPDANVPAPLPSEDAGTLTTLTGRADYSLRRRT